jgi:hypothetical protein
MMNRKHTHDPSGYFKIEKYTDVRGGVSELKYREWELFTLKKREH